MLGERSPQPYEVPRAKRHGAAPRGAPGGIGEPDEHLALPAGKELDDCGEALVTRALRNGQLLDHLRLPPGCRCFRHPSDRSATIRAGVSRNVTEGAPPVTRQAVQIRELEEADRGWIDGFVTERWGSPVAVAHGVVFRPSELPGYIALEGGEPVGLATYSVDGDACELVTIDSVVEGRGVGSALLEAVIGAARVAGCRRLRLTTTNDNLPALRFYQKRGFALVALRRGAVAESRRLKPEIPPAGLDGIPLRDELELELEL
jgi:GNAT superfamily N-acetyltransferase